MSALGPYAGFIVTAYALAFAVIAVLVVWVVADHRVQARRLASLDERGMTRRSAAEANRA